MNPIVDDIVGYVDETRDELVAKSVLGGKSASMFNLMTGVKGATALHILDTEVVFQDGSECGWSPSGTSEISNRTITPAYYKVNTTFCDKNLLNTYASHMVKIAAGQKTLPYEKEFVDGIVDKVKEGVENMIWQGGSYNDGLLQILEEDGATIVDEVSGTSAYQAIKDVYAAVPEHVLQKEDLVIFVGAGLFRKYIQEIVAANLYHYDATDTPMEHILEGTNVRVVAVNGLNDIEDYDCIVAASLSNLYYATDMQGDEEKFDLWYSKDNREFRLAIEFAFGVQVAFPDDVVVGRIAK